MNDTLLPLLSIGLKLADNINQPVGNFDNRNVIEPAIDTTVSQFAARTNYILVVIAEFK